MSDFKVETIAELPGFSLRRGIIKRPLELIRNLKECSGWKSVSKSADSRQVLHFGYDYNYIPGSGPAVRKSEHEIPTFLESLRQLALEITGSDFDQCIVNRYIPGEGIAKHIDALSFGPVIACFSVGSSTSMIFRHKEDSVEVTVPENSLYIMSEDARYKWTHEMPARKTDNNIKRDTRYSITFRKVL
jgi:alkylated DNA repair dioxygenase AlkB